MLHTATLRRSTLRSSETTRSTKMQLRCSGDESEASRAQCRGSLIEMLRDE